MSRSLEESLAILEHFEDVHLKELLSDNAKQVWSLDAITAFMAAIGDPHLAYPTIHVTGSKGKGSTCVFIASALTAAGKKIGLYTTPPLMDFRESIQIDGQWISREALALLIDETFEIARAIPKLSRFEYETGLAFLYYARQGADYAVIEVGMGGRVDATNIIQPAVTVITPISLEHTAFLGGTLAAIASEKSGTLKLGIPVVLAAQDAEALAVIESRASALGCPIYLAGRDYRADFLRGDLVSGVIRFERAEVSEEIPIGLPGLFQAENAGAALMALALLSKGDHTLKQEALHRGIANAYHPGRLEVVGRDPLFILDGAHTPESIQRLVESLRALLPSSLPITIVFGCMRDKDYHAMLAELLPIADHIILTCSPSERATSPDTLFQAAADLISVRQNAESYGKIPKLSVYDDAVGALALARQHTPPMGAIIATGSLAIVGALRPESAD